MFTSYPTSPTALPSSPDANKFCPSSESQPGGILDKYNTFISLNLTSREYLEWWVALTTPMGALVCLPDPSITVHPDASNQGWGEVMNGRPTQVSQGGNSPHQLTGVVSCLPSNQSIGRISQVLLQMDNITAVSYNQKGGTVSRAQ